MMVSIAVHVDAELLRHARLKLTTGLDVGSEADLWFSPWVATRASDSIVLRPEVRERLHSLLAERLAHSEADADPVHQVWSVFSEVHASLSPALLLEEHLVWLSLLPGDHLEEIEAALQPAVNAVVFEGRAGVVDWFGGALSRLPEMVRLTLPAWQLAQLARRSLPAGRPESLRLRDIGILASRLPEVDLMVGRHGETLVLGGSEGSVIPIADTDPRVATVSWLSSNSLTSVPVQVPVQGVRTVNVGDAPLVWLQTASGAVHEIGQPVIGPTVSILLLGQPTAGWDRVDLFWKFLRTAGIDAHLRTSHTRDQPGTVTRTIVLCCRPEDDHHIEVGDVISGEVVPVLLDGDLPSQLPPIALSRPGTVIRIPHLSLPGISGLLKVLYRPVIASAPGDNKSANNPPAARIFISYADRDRAWAEWARWHLEAAGHSTELDSVDWAPGTNVVEATNRALQRAQPLLALLSAAYLDTARFATDEWVARFAQRRGDPDAKLIPVRIESVDLSDGIWAPIVVPDVFDLPPDQAATLLINTVRRVVGSDEAIEPPRTPPEYPGHTTTGPPVNGPRPPGSLPAVWNLARRNPGFTGRDAVINRLHDALQGGSRLAVQAVHGWGGVGKTQLVLEYAYRFAGEYDLVWWIPAEQPDLIGDHLAALADRLRLVAAGSGIREAVGALRDHLRTVERWLLVFDNAEDRDQLASWLVDGPGHILITSRNPNWTAVANSIDIDVFTRSESMEMLSTHLPNLSNADTDRLAAALGDLPLAIGQAVDLLAETGIPVESYLHELAEHAASLMGEGRPPAGYPASLAATTTLAADRLNAADPAAGQLLYICSRLGPEPIPADLFTGQPGLLPEPLSSAARRPVVFARTMGWLGRYGLARLTGNGPVLHRLVQAVLRDADPDPETHHDTAEHLLAAATPDDGTHPQWWPRWSVLLPHILAVDPAVTGNRELRAAANSAVWHLMARGDSRAALPLAGHLHQSWTLRHGPDDDSSRAMAHTLAAIFRVLGNYQRARDLDEDNLVRNRRLYGDDHPDTLRSAINLAIDLRELGEFGKARDLDEDSLARARRVLGDDHPITFLSANSLAGDLRELGEHGRAREVDEDALARSRRVLGDEHPDTLRAASNLAIDLQLLGDFERAQALSQDTLARKRRVLGDDHPNTLLSASNLAIDLRELGEYERARELNEDTLNRRRRVLGDDHPDTLRSARSLARDLDSLGRYAEAADIRRAFPSKA
jgi:hypothetical protein